MGRLALQYTPKNTTLLFILFYRNNSSGNTGLVKIMLTLMDRGITLRTGDANLHFYITTVQDG